MSEMIHCLAENRKPFSRKGGFGHTRSFILPKGSADRPENIRMLRAILSLGIETTRATAIALTESDVAAVTRCLHQIERIPGAVSAKGSCHPFGIMLTCSLCLLELTRDYLVASNSRLPLDMECELTVTASCAATAMNRMLEACEGEPCAVSASDAVKCLREEHAFCDYAISEMLRKTSHDKPDRNPVSEAVGLHTGYMRLLKTFLRAAETAAVSLWDIE